ncbi:MAG: sugar ABC transporter permease [Actinomycetota bacterium]
MLALFIAANAAGSLGRLLSTIGTTAIAIGIVAAIWLAGNAIVSQVSNRWPLFIGLSWGLTAAILFAVMRGNEVITALFAEEDPIAFGAGGGAFGRLEWPIVGAIIWGGGAALIGTLGNRLARLGVGIGLGVLTGILVAPNLLIWQRASIPVGSTILWVLVGVIVGAAAHRAFPNRSASDPVPGALVGAAIGWTIAVWLRASFVASFEAPYVATIVPLALIGARIAWKGRPSPRQIARLEERGRALLFLGPALLFLSAALIIPAIITVRLSFLDRDGEESVGFDNYREYFGRDDAFNVSNWTNLFGSQLFWIAVVLVIGGILIGTFIGTTRNGQLTFEGSNGSIGTLGIGFFVFFTAVFSVLRGTFFNNLWWIMTVTVMSVALGLLVAVLAERAGRFENVAKSLVFMPLAVSFVGASIIWRLQYQARPVQKSQTGLLNWFWVKLGELSHSGWPRMLAIVVMILIMARIGQHLARRVQRGDNFAGQVVALIVMLYVLFQLLGRSLGGFVLRPDGSTTPETVLFIQNPPFNNVFLMIILIWIQTGFAMVILSAAIKAVPSDYIEAARVDGATETQTFFNIILPSILPTIGVITTTLIVLVTKVFDIVKVTSNGNFGTNVLANDFFTVRFSFFDNGLGSAIATIILLMVLPIMILNIRRMQVARNA